MRRKFKVRNLISIIGLAILMIPAISGAVVIEPRIQVDHPVILADSSLPVYVILRFDIPIRPPDPDLTRPDLNLALVIDRSGSMEDKGKMDYAIEAANLLVDHLQPTDRLSVVDYDDIISVLWPSTLVKSPEMIKAKINSLFPRNSTNLCGGMMRGVEQVTPYVQGDQINRVILLSDGLANTGITSPNEIRKLVRESKNKGVTITAMGLGLEYNEDLLQLIAENSGGNYYFIENPKQMARIFDNELGTLFATVGKDVRLNFRASSQVQNIKVYGYVSQTDNNSTNIEMENFYTGEKRTLVLRLDLDPLAVGEYDLGQIAFDYKDLESDQVRTFSAPIKVRTTTNSDEVKQAEVQEAMVEALLVEADNLHLEQIRIYESGDKQTALDNISQYSSVLKSANLSLQDKMIEKKIEALNMEADEMKWAEEDAENMKYYNVQNKMRFYQSQKGKRGYYIMQKGDTGLQVENLKQALSDAGFYKGTVDEEFTDDLVEAVEKFQKSEGLTVDGVAGPMTLKKLGLY